MNSFAVLILLAAGATAMYGPPGGDYNSPPSSISNYYVSSGSSNYDASSSGESIHSIPITSFTRTIKGTQSDTTSFTTGNGISSSFNVHTVRGSRPSSYLDEYGRMVESDSTIVMNGHSYHQSPEGQHISLTWSAGEAGFQPQGEHLPRPVPMPADHAQAHRQAYAHSSVASPY